MQYSVVPFSKLKIDSNCLRVDAEFFRSEFLDVEKLLKKEGFKTLKEYEVKIYHPNEIKRQYTDSKNGIRFLRAQNVRPFFADLESNPVFIDKQDARKLNKNTIKNKDILITRTGANFGQCCIYLNNDNPIASSHTFICKSGYLEAEFLMIFLNSKYGRILLDKGMYGGVQPEIAPFYIYNIPIPNISKDFQKLISNFLKLSSDFKESSKSLYNEAENLLLEELGLKDWKPKHQLSYIKKYSDTQKAERFDAEYFQPQYDEVIEKVKNIQNDDLGNIVKWSKGIEVGSEQYIDEGFDFIRISDFNTKGLNETSKKISKELFLELKDKFSPKKGDILFTKDGTIGLTYLVNQDQEAIISGAFLKLRPKIDIESEYLALVLNSIICKKQIEMMSGGAIIAHLKPSDAMKLQIPILSPKKQQEISSKIIDSKEKDNQSKSLLSIAKKAVEMAIETSEEQASSWIDEELEKLGVELKKE